MSTNESPGCRCDGTRHGHGPIVGRAKPSVVVTKMAHPDLDRGTAERTAEAYESIAAQNGSAVSEMATESRRAEASSAAGEELST